MHLSGLHHLTAVTARIRDNHAFYTGVMGMRLVKRSVNQDDVSAYHLFYADAVGSPGTDLTFFDWSVPREVRGSRSIAATGLRVRDAEDLAWWMDRLTEHGVTVAPGIEEVGGRPVLSFEDAEGQRLQLVADGGAGPAPTPWHGSPVPAERQLRGLGPVTLSLPDLAPTERILEGLMEMRKIGTHEAPDTAGTGRTVTVHRWEMGEGGGPHAELHLADEPHLGPVRPGAGGVHHVAFRIPDGDYDAWAAHLNDRGVANSGKVDRYYFRSLYFREPGGVLFELATDGPGFAVDEDPEHLGESVALPPFLESRRDAIEANLRPID
jgi:glyoxalase family protein